MIVMLYCICRDSILNADLRLFITNVLMTEELVICEIRINETAGRGDSDSWMMSFQEILPLRAAANESQKTRNKRQNGLAHSRFIVCVTPNQEKHCLIRESCFQRNMCETANQQSISSHMVVYMACKMRCRWLTFRRCFVNRALSRNRSLRDAKPARHLFVWFAKHYLAEHCLLFRGDADECEKQFCLVFRICLAFFDSRLWRPLNSNQLWKSYCKMRCIAWAGDSWKRMTCLDKRINILSIFQQFPSVHWVRRKKSHL